ncbi:response regulator [Paenibacillus sp. MBLB4367]|uniref:response regulator n=1 Tax=Paenibacillus sp. MBLB4367 TaxID=3384767 RepID=UPI0039083E3F
MYNVLLVDDEQLDLDVLQRFVPWEKLGMAIIGTVRSGFAALNALREQRVDILVTDIRMSIMSGLELASRQEACFPS